MSLSRNLYSRSSLKRTLDQRYRTNTSKIVSKKDIKKQLEEDLVNRSKKRTVGVGFAPYTVSEPSTTSVVRPLIITMETTFIDPEVTIPDVSETVEESGGLPFVLESSETSETTTIFVPYILIPTNSDATYDCTVDWGDGTTDTINTWDDDSWFHIYENEGEYDITITGKFGAFFFNYDDECEKILDIKQWGDTVWDTMYEAFDGCYNMTVTATDSPNLSQVTDYTWAFSECDSIMDFSSFDMSNGEIFYYTWAYNYGITSFDGFDLSNGINFDGTWEGCINLESFTNIDMSSVAGELRGSDVGPWFQCINLTLFSNNDIRSVTDIHSVWTSIPSLTEFVGNNLSGVTDAYKSFYNSSSLVTFSDNDMSGITTFEDKSTFEGCSSLETFSGNNLSRVSVFDGFLEDLESLTNYSNNNMSGGTSFVNAWKNCGSLISFNNNDLQIGTNFEGAWQECSNLSEYTGNIIINGVNFNYAWYNTDIESFHDYDLSNGIYFQQTWYGCSLLVEFYNVDMSGSNDYCYGTWQNCTNLVTFHDVNISNESNFGETWEDCVNLTEFYNVDMTSAIFIIDAWRNTGFVTFPVLDLPNVLVLNGAWSNCSSLSSFPSMDLSNATNISTAWDGCNNLTDFGNINCVSIESLIYTWRDCSSLSSFETTEFDSITNGANAFLGVTLPTETYSQILINLAANNTNTGVSFSGGNSKYNNSAVDARAYLVNDQEWLIRDGGLET